MFKRTMVLFFLFGLIELSGQNSEASPKERTLFEGFTVGEFGFYAGTGLQVSPINNENVLLQNLGAGVVLNHKFRLGATFAYALSDMGLMVDGQKWQYDLLMGGMELEYVFFPNKVVHFTAPLQIGVVYNEFDENDENVWLKDYEEYLFGYVQPGLQLEVNVLPYLRVNGGAFYRLVYGNGEAPLGPQQLSGAVLNFGIKIGKF